MKCEGVLLGVFLLLRKAQVQLASARESCFRTPVPADPSPSAACAKELTLSLALLLSGMVPLFPIHGRGD